MPKKWKQPPNVCFHWNMARPCKPLCRQFGWSHVCQSCFASCPYGQGRTSCVSCAPSFWTQLECQFAPPFNLLAVNAEQRTTRVKFRTPSGSVGTITIHLDDCSNELKEMVCMVRRRMAEDSAEKQRHLKDPQQVIADFAEKHLVYENGKLIVVSDC